MRYINYILLLSLILTACASPKAPSGGPKDKTPPQIIEESSTKNFTTNFSEREFHFTFDEWVKLTDTKSILVSPPLKHKPQYKLLKKTLFIEFHEEEVLHENTTYTFNFGESIKDFTEGNPADNLMFVFSTGDVLDSLEIMGQVKNALTQKPIDKGLVLLYEKGSDSLFTKGVPYYFAKLNKGGSFSIKNIKSGEFSIYALIDDNNNLKYDIGESIAFQEKSIVLPDSTNAKIELSIFTEEAEIDLLDNDFSRKGIDKLVFNKSPEGIKWSFIPPNENIFREIDGDTLILWHSLPDSLNKKIVLFKDTILLDTIKLKKKRKKDIYKIDLVEKGVKTFNPYDSLLLDFNIPISQIDTSRIILYFDTIKVDNSNFHASLDSISKNLKMVGNIPPKSLYKMTFLPESLTDFFGNSNEDSLSVGLKMLTEEDLGKIIFSIDSVIFNNSAIDYIINLKSKDEIIRTKTIKDGDLSEFSFIGLLPNKYSLEIIYDENKNGKWDTGNLKGRKQPEKIIIKEIEKVRANWELEVSLNL